MVYFGMVFDGMLLVVKRSKGLDMSFFKEVDMFSWVYYWCVVCFLGYCDEKSMFYVILLFMFCLICYCVNY